MRRLAFAIVVALLTFSASGASALVFPEPCTAYEQQGREDGSCPPTCVTCGCCAQAVEPVAFQVTASPEVPIAEIHTLVPPLPESRARDILHVPRLPLA